MTNETFNNKINDIKEKIGEENSATISDILSELLTENSVMNETINNQKNELEKKEQEKAELLKTNGRLVQQVTATVLEKSSKKPEEEQKEYSKDEIFDKKGNFLI